MTIPHINGLEGKIVTGKPHLEWENPWFPVTIFPKNPHKGHLYHLAGIAPMASWHLQKGAESGCFC